MAFRDPNYPSDRDGEGQWEGEYEEYDDQDFDQPDDQWPAPEDFHSTGYQSDGMEISQNPQSEPLQIQQQAPMPAEQFALERSDSRNESETGKRRRTEDLLERPSRASPQPEVSVDQNLVQYFRGLEIVSDKMDNLGDQLTGVEHGMSDIRGNMKILWRKSNEREYAQNILSKNLELEKIHQRAVQTENSRAM
jgi:hypothetical protein